MASKPKLDHCQLHDLPAPKLLELLCCMSSNWMLTSHFLVAISKGNRENPAAYLYVHHVYDIRVISISYER